MPTKVEKDSLTGTDTTGHEWDGLKELNTPLPKWWLYVFYATIAFSVVWMVVYPSLPVFGLRGTSGWVAREALAPVLEQQRARQEPMLARIRAATPGQVAADPELRAFAGRRAHRLRQCLRRLPRRGRAGRAGRLPVAGRRRVDLGGGHDTIAETIRHGVRNGEDEAARTSLMPAFAAMMTPAQIGEVAEYVLALSNRGTNPAAAERGKAAFEEQCASCHMPDGRGNRDVGAPNLTDQVWL
jgi:cytochrome c oxidase cbb3-type subunit 3